MKALLLSEYSRLEMAELPMPRPAADEVLVRVKACGICGSDVHGYDGSSGRRIPPLVMGHEASGVIVAVGSNVTRLRENDRVTFDSTIYCGICDYCVRGQVNLCDRRQVLGVSTPDFRRAGAFAEYIVVPERLTYRLPDEVSFTAAAMIEPIAVAVHAVSLANVPEKAVAVVVGAGMIGLLTVQVLREAGCSRILVTDIDDTRLALAKQMGATDVVNGKTADASGEFSHAHSRRRCGPRIRGCWEYTYGNIAINSVKKGGTVVLIGNVTPKMEIPLQAVVSRELRLQGTAASSGEYPECIELLRRGAVRVDELISVVAPLEEGAVWFERLHERQPNLMKVILTPEAPEKL